LCPFFVGEEKTEGKNMAAQDTLLRDLIEPIVTALGFELWGFEYNTGGRQAMLRIYIESENGIDVDDCAKVSRQVGSVFDVEDPVAGEYTLEVSSPGMDRPLYTKEQFEKYIGEKVSVRLRMAFEGRKKFSGQLTGVEGDDVVIAVDKDEYLLPLELIDKANVVPTFE
jgi:ribosome maturation factor RimP